MKLDTIPIFKKGNEILQCPGRFIHGILVRFFLQVDNISVANRSCASLSSIEVLPFIIVGVFSRIYKRLVLP